MLTAQAVRDSLRKRRRPGSPLLILDLGVPRNVEPEAGRLEQVYLRNIDDLQSVVEKDLAKREQELATAQGIVNRRVEAFLSGCAETAAGPRLSSIRARADEIAEAELARALVRMPHLGEQERLEIRSLLRRTIGKVLHEPTEVIKEAARCGHFNAHEAGRRRFRPGPFILIWR